MNEPRISCILPALGDFDACVRSIKCFKAQTYENRELIVVDTGVNGLAEYIERMADPMIVRLATTMSSVVQLYATGISRSTGSLVAAWPEFAYSDPIRLTFQHEIIKGEDTEASVISSISLAVLGKRRFGYSRQGVWTSTLLAPREKFLRFSQSEELEDSTDAKPDGILLSKFTAPDLFVASLPEQDDAFIDRRFEGAHTKLDITDLIRIIEKLKYPDHANSPSTAHATLYQAFQLQPLDRAMADKYFSAFLETPLAAEWPAFDVLKDLAFFEQSKGNTPQFLQYATKLLLIDPSRAEGHVLLGIHFWQQGQAGKAIPFFTAATKATRPFLPYHANWSYYTWLPYDYLSDCYRMLGDIEKAIEMRMIAQRSPDQKARLKGVLKGLIDLL